MTITNLVFKAIAHPVRREIISLLAVSDRSVKELTSEFEMSQSAVSQHLKELRDAYLVSSDRVGLEQRYRLTPHPLKFVIEWSEQLKALIDPSGRVWMITSPQREQAIQEPDERQLELNFYIDHPQQVTWANTCM
jgi:DNA-binding transcriptional ArsR family regulator